MGVCFAHEHLWIDSKVVREQMPEYLLNDIGHAVHELRGLFEAGGRTCIDAMPGDAGRGLDELVQIAQATRLHIVASTGAHLAKYYESDHWSFHESSETMAQRFISEIQEGEVKAGVIKVASEASWGDRECRIFHAAAEAHQVTGAPILTHTEQGFLALEQVEIFKEGGVSLEGVILSHTDRKPDLAYHREILSTGVRVEYDSSFRWKGELNPTRDLILAFAGEFPDQILLGMDAARKSYWRSSGGSPGLDYLIKDFKADLMSEGLDEKIWTKIMVGNPASAFAFRSS
jgi:phosphotriesterase-related protein